MKRRPRKFADGGSIREEENENIGSDSRARAMEYLQGKRKSGEAAPSAEPDKPAPRAANPAAPAAKPSPKPAAPAAPTAKDPSIPEATYGGKPTPKPGMMERAARSVFPNPSFPGKGPESSLPAIAGVGAPAAARGAGRLAGGLASASKQGWEAGEAAKAAAREAAAARGAANRGKAAELVGRDRAARASARNRSESDEGMEAARMTAEGGMRRPASMPMRKRGGPEDLDEIRMAGEGGPNFKRGGKVKKYAAGGSVSASRRADGIAQRGKTRGKVC